MPRVAFGAGLVQGLRQLRGELRGDKLDLAALAKIAGRLPLPPKLHEQLQAQPVKGLVESITARWDGALDRMQLQRALDGRLPDLATDPASPRVPGADPR